MGHLLAGKYTSLLGDLDRQQQSAVGRVQSSMCREHKISFLATGKGIGALSSWFHLWDRDTRVEVFPYDSFSTPPGSQQSPEMAEVTGMGSITFYLLLNMSEPPGTATFPSPWSLPN